MKILVISDTHLSHKFNERKYNFLANLIKEADRVIINGDFWDYWFTDFSKFVQSKWNKLFPLLKEKNTVYVHGNHDPKESLDTRTRLFSIKNVDQYEEVINGVNFTFNHGQNLLENKKSRYLEIYDAVLTWLESTMFTNVVHHFLTTTEKITYYVLGANTIKNCSVIKNNNNLLKNISKKLASGWLICGHTHGENLDSEARFANSGAIIYNQASYILITDGQPELLRSIY